MFPKDITKSDAPPDIEMTPLAGGNFVIELQNGRQAEVKRLDGFDQLKADALCGATESGMQVSRTYGICMLQKIDGNPVAPLANDLEFQNTARSLTAGDTLILARVYGQLEKVESGPALKNAPSVAGD